MTKSRTFPPDDIVWVDESGVTDHYVRDYGIAPRGVKVYGNVSGKRYKRLNIISALCGDKRIATYTYAWATNSKWFEVWFEWHLCPHLPPGKVVVMDNALFHRKKPLEAIAAFYGLRIIWLPPYSPDFNRIEHLWANLKKWLKSFAVNFATIQVAVHHYFIVG